MTTNHYIAFTIGPIIRTIGRARKTRELWAASYVFSLLMFKILQQLKPEDLLLPFFPKEADNPSHLGAGIWPDRCMLQIKEGNLPDVQNIIDNAYANLAEDLNVTSDRLQSFFNVHVLQADWRENGIENDATDDERDLIPVHRINRLLDNLELAAHYEAEENHTLNQLLLDNILSLYNAAGHKGSSVFIPLEDDSSRLPSLPEIALMEIKKSQKAEIAQPYSTVVETPINHKIMEIRSGNKRAKDYDGEASNEQLYLDLKKVLPPDTIAFRHKYVAIVVADGDSMGKIITTLSQQENGNLHTFSKSLMDFSRQAVQDIANYGGLPIYAGGDDLLFMAPVTNGHSDVKNILQLCHQLNGDFKEKMGEMTSLSFGLSITYYKFPLGEAVKEAYHLEKKAKSFKLWSKDNNPEKKHAKPDSKKEALCFQVRKHSGQQFGATLNLQADSTDYLMEMLNAEAKVEGPLLSSLMYKLQELPTLLAEAARSQSLTHFRENHFNEGGKHNDPFLKKAMKLAGMVFDDYGDYLSSEIIESMKKDPAFKDKEAKLIDLHHTNILFAALRLKQFLIQKDHD